MRTVVCVKQVNGELNPFDACALECALQIPDNEITVISMGRPGVAEMLLQLTRLGNVRGILLSDAAFAGADTLATAYVLSLAIRRLCPDLILCGRQAIDGDTAQTSPALAALLEIPAITNVLSLEVRENGLHCTTRLGKEYAAFPCLATVERINNLRFPSIRSKVSEVSVLSAQDLEADMSRCGLAGSPTRVLHTFESTQGRRKCTFIEFSQLKQVLEERVGVRKNILPPASDTRLPAVTVVGPELAALGKSIAERVSVIHTRNPHEILAEIQTTQTEFVLFPADLWGRRVAPYVQARLQTGLCADCTHLETDGKDLFMFRPAFGGSLTAKIACKTRPVLATVRTSAEASNEIILSAGLGALPYVEDLQKLALEKGYRLMASRGLVDKMGLPYELQIGLTGCTVAPSIYIACGISGAVHHTCAIEGTATVIAVNPDRNARIFDYADFGIVGDGKKLALALI